MMAGKRTVALSYSSRIRPTSRIRDGAVPLLRVSRRFFPFIERVFADSAYAGDNVANATRIAVEIVKKLADQIGFVILPRRWVVERFFVVHAAAASTFPTESGTWAVDQKTHRVTATKTAPKAQVSPSIEEVEVAAARTTVYFAEDARRHCFIEAVHYPHDAEAGRVLPDRPGLPG